MAENVLVGYDGSESSRWALTWAVTEARRRRAQLTVVVIVEQAELAHCRPAQMVRWWDAARARGERRAVEAAQLAAAQEPDVEILTDIGSPSGLLVSACRRADMVVLGAGAKVGALSRRPGPVVRAVATQARCPVVIVGQKDPAHAGPDRRVVVGIDGSRRALQALDFAAASAAAVDARLHAVCVWSNALARPTAAGELAPDSTGRPQGDPHDPAAARRAVEVALAQATARFPHLRTSSEAVAGYPPAVLIRAARGAGLVAVGRRGAGADRSLVLGSVSRAVLRAVPRPVAVVGILAAAGPAFDTDVASVLDVRPDLASPPRDEMVPESTDGLVPA